jgi:tripartite-type tricarboxylate transporter receptor subunit TctC
MSKKLAVIAALILAVAIAVTGCPSQAGPASPADFYKGKSIEVVSTATPGIVDDLVLRIIASYLGKDTGATVIVSDRRGAGGMEGMNYLYTAKPDGLTLGGISSTKFLGNKVMGEPAAEYEIEKFSYVMSVGRRLTYFYVSLDGPYQTVAELQAAQGLKLGATSPSGYFSLAGLTVIKILGLDAKLITGFGGADLAPAVKRGEVAGYAGLGAGGEGMITPLFVLATERDPLMPDVPAVTELVSLSGEDLEMVRLWETALAGSSLFMAPPGLPEDRLAFFRDLADKWAQDEEFRAEINVVSGSELKPGEYVTGEEVNRIMMDTASRLSEYQAIFADLVAKYRA